jgi:RimJ/RimL family protein N-acetyltransferase
MTTIPENEELPRLAERLGFRREDVLRARNLGRGRSVDIIYFGLRRDEWLADRA